MGNFFSWIQDLFWSQEMEIAILGVSAAGKSSFVHVVDTGHFESELPPTLGFNIHSVKRNAVTIKVWDMGGQKKFQGMWERYCREVDVIVFVVDSADAAQLSTVKTQLHDTLQFNTLKGIPLLVLFNKNDLPEALPWQEVYNILELDSIKGERLMATYSVSCKNNDSIDKAMEWICAQVQSK